MQYMAAINAAAIDPIEAEQEEYRRQLAHADFLIEELVEERDRLQQERDELRRILGMEPATQLRLMN